MITEVDCFGEMIWQKQEQYSIGAAWLHILKQTVSYGRKEALHFTEESIRNLNEKIINWKATGSDGAQGFCTKKSIDAIN